MIYVQIDSYVMENLYARVTYARISTIHTSHSNGTLVSASIEKTIRLNAPNTD